MFHLPSSFLIWEMSRPKAGQLTSLTLRPLPSVWLGNLERKEQMCVNPFGNGEISKLIKFYYEKSVQNVNETVLLGHRLTILYLL